MKVWILFFAAVVWMQLPAQGNAKSLGAAVRAVSATKGYSKVAKRLVKREDTVSPSEELTEDVMEKLKNFLAENEKVKDYIENNPGIIDILNEMVDKDEEVQEKDKPMVKILAIFMLAGIDIKDLDNAKNSEESGDSNI